MVRPTAATIHALDDHLLGRIIELAGREAGRAAASVCRHWRDVVFSAPGLWRTLRLAPTARDGAERCAWLAAKHRLLQRVGPLAEELDIDDFCELLRLVGGPDAASLAAGVLAHVQPERLLSLAFDCAVYGADSSPRQQLAEQHYDTALGVAAAMLPRCRQLEQLVFVANTLPPAVEAAIPALTTLRQLRLSYCPVPPRLLATIAEQLPLLEVLCLDPEGPELPPLLPLTKLQHLTCLEASNDYSYAPWCVPPIPAFPALKAYNLCSEQGVQVEGLPGELELSFASYDTAENQRERLRWYAAKACGGNPSWMQLTMGQRGEEEVLLQPVLEALLPPGAQLDSLFLDDCSLGASQLQGCSQLASLRDVCIAYPYRLPAEAQAQTQAQAPPMLACLLQQAPHLAALTVQAGFPLELPQCVAQRSGLTRLALRYCGLTQLPAGPYLSDLQQLELTGHNFNALPPALAAATALRQLILRHSDSP